MIEKLRKLADLRRSLLIWMERKKEVIAEFEAANAALFEQLKKSVETVNLAETRLKADALAQFRLDGNRKPAPGLEVKDFMVLDYLEEEAMAWGLKTGMAVKLDKVAFEKIAKATPLDFVSFHYEPRCQIATDLDKALEGVKV